MDFYEIFNLGFTVGGAGSYSWSPDDLKETKYRKVSDSDLEEVKLLYKRLMEIPQTMRDALRVPLDRWTKSMGQKDPIDRIIDLGIALESLYLNDRKPSRRIRIQVSHQSLLASWKRSGS